MFYCNSVYIADTVFEAVLGHNIAIHMSFYDRYWFALIGNSLSWDLNWLFDTVAYVCVWIGTYPIYKYIKVYAP